MNIELFLYKLERENFSQYLDLIDETLKRKGEEVEKWIKEQENKDLSGEETANFDAWVEAESESLSMYSDLAFESFAVWLCAYLEKKLDELCDRFISRQKSILKLSDIAGKGIERAKIFMKKVAKWQLPEDDLWEKLVYLREIRNVIVHNGGIIKTQKLREFIDKQNKEEIFYWQNRKIVLSKKYCIKLLDFVFDYLTKLAELKPSK